MTVYKQVIVNKMIRSLSKQIFLVTQGTKQHTVFSGRINTKDFCYRPGAYRPRDLGLFTTLKSSLTIPESSSVHSLNTYLYIST